FELTDSHANFVFARHDAGQVIFDRLNERNIVIRHWDTPGLREWLRITVGAAEQNDAILTALREIAAEL
ncbi:MAG: aminotransferase class I/II-fold pyridoxal phosphate-dependent enzyme, partial [Planctomycetota bacterium]